MKEIWKPIPIEEFDKFYEVSNLGNVRPICRRVGNTRKTLTNLKPKLMHDGYLFTRLNAYNGQRYFNTHRLVALAFIPNPENKAYVNHINFNKTDNRVENLEWVTASENTLHARRGNRFNPEPKERLSTLKNNNLLPVNFEELKKQERRKVYRAAYKKAMKLGLFS